MERAAFERLRWRCTRRGMLEVDMVLGRFLKEAFGKLPESGQQAFIALADYDDMALWRLISAQDECEDARLAPIVAMLRGCK
ncbi:MAG: succinate dehydrogenase assembly factor 2 [Zoogloeaceae bacterium]|jgi:succinate dehydrogenase flavin-adding protein (antitoxin of CptAB toxin-antitoxin module)|nr:succinate dehydrogenase assembly factor 2 [Zoogloeaceae bacterium]